MTINNGLLGIVLDQCGMMNATVSSPPDTTTHSPRSPERPESHRSNASDTNMVICCVLRILFYWLRV